jgi:hypothetical protein
MTWDLFIDIKTYLLIFRFYLIILNKEALTLTLTLRLLVLLGYKLAGLGSDSLQKENEH